VPSNLIPIAALIQSIENKLAWWRIDCFFSSVSTTVPLWNRA